VTENLEARVRDTERSLDRFDGRLGRIEEDMRAFRPIPLENAKDRATVEALAADVHEAHDGIRELRAELTEDRKERHRIRREREEKEREREKVDAKEKADRAATERRDRWTRVAVVLTLTLAFISMTINMLLQAL
jgi:predicted  nucleic acid-binding Zn-ribbon protein